jgi:saccharopine dehydrogenase (NADP+, L-glutamate forming)
MQNILIIGAGRSSSFLIKYLIEQAPVYNWNIRVADMDLSLAQSKINNSTRAQAVTFDVNNAEHRSEHITWANVVVSMLPANMHINVANDCLRLQKHLITASYISPSMAALHKQAVQSNLLFLNEVGLDPGIDHMSAMEVIDQLKEKGAEIRSFKSYCGGLIAPESCDNPWGYKFTWNPRNVILAGQGTAQYIENNELKFIPYNRIFTQIEKIEFDGLGWFEGYANRDSLSYRKPYGLENIPTILRGTLRYSGFCNAWNIFVKLGWTDDTYTITNLQGKSYTDLLRYYLPESPLPIKERLIAFLGNEATEQSIRLIEWLGIFNNEPILLNEGTPAQLLQNLLERKWILKPTDKDLVVMQHVFDYWLNGVTKRITSSLIVKGIDQTHTAMAKTVGLPAAICVKLLLTGKISLRGVQLPVHKEIYQPVLQELKTLGISFVEKQTILT